MVLDLLLIARFYLVLGGAEQVDLFSILALFTVSRNTDVFNCWQSLANAVMEI